MLHFAVSQGKLFYVTNQILNYSKGEKLNIKEENRKEKSGELKKFIDEAESKIRNYNSLSMEDIANNEVLGYEIDYYLNLLKGFED
jgi:DNA-directed RNA polymerase alpha subunit